MEYLYILNDYDFYIIYTFERCENKVIVYIAAYAGSTNTYYVEKEIELNSSDELVQELEKYFAKKDYLAIILLLYKRGYLTEEEAHFLIRNSLSIIFGC